MRRSFARVLCRSRAFTRLRVPLARGIWGMKVARLEIRVATPLFADSGRERLAGSIHRQTDCRMDLRGERLVRPAHAANRLAC